MERVLSNVKAFAALVLLIFMFNFFLVFGLVATFLGI